MKLKENQIGLLAASIVAAALIVSCVFVIKKSPVVVNVPWRENKGDSKVVVEMPPFALTNVVNCGVVASDGSASREGLSVVVDKLLAHDNEIRRAEREQLLQEKAVADAKASRDYELRNEQQKREAMTALFAINHINWVVTKIKTYNDPAVLEEEYRGLTADALNLRVIKDPELVDVICRILDVIVEMRIEEKERAFLKDELDQGNADAIADAVSGIRITGLNPVSMIASAVTSVASAALNYKKAKRALQKKFEKQNWELDKNRMYYLNDLNKELLRNFWAIVQKYPELPDEYRITEKNIQLLVDHLKDDDALKRHDFLRAFQDQFAGFQPYWYHRAAAAYEVACNGDLDQAIRDEARCDARLSLGKYVEIQVECGNIVRKDPTAAKAALLQAALLSEDGSKDRRAYQDAINIVVRNSSAEDWQAAYFCAMVAVRELDDIEQAERILAPAIADLDWQRRRRLADWKDELETKFELKSGKKASDLLTVGDALYECRTLVASVAKLSDAQYGSKLARICSDGNASMREKMFCYGAMGYKQALEKLRPDVSKMRCYVREGKLFVSVPFSWVLARGAVMALVVDHCERKESGERTIEPRDDGSQYVMLDFGSVDGKVRKVDFRSRFDRNGRDASGRPEKVSYMVEVAFENKGFEYEPVKATFGKWLRGTEDSAAGWCQTVPDLAADPGTPAATAHDDVEVIELQEDDVEVIEL